MEQWCEELVFFLDLTHLLFVEGDGLYRDAALVHGVQVSDAGDVVALWILL